MALDDFVKMMHNQSTLSSKRQIKKMLSNTIKNYNDIKFSELQLTEQTFEGIEFTHCTFSQCDFSQAKFTRCKFIDCEFTDCNLTLISINGSSFSETILTQSKVTGVNWSTAKWPQIRLTSPISFYHCNISHSNFFELSLVDITIESCKAHGVDFRGTDLASAHLSGSDFYQSLFINTKLMGADFTDAINYDIDLHLNDIRKATFSFPEVISLLNCLDIQITGFTQENE